MTCNPAKSVELMLYIALRPGFSRTSTRRSACSSGTSRAASCRSGLTSCHDQRCGTAAVTRSFGKSTCKAVHSGPSDSDSSECEYAAGSVSSRVESAMEVLRGWRISRARLPPMRFEVEVYKNDLGEWVAEAVDYKVTATGRTESEALARVMDALAAHFKQTAKH